MGGCSAVLSSHALASGLWGAFIFPLVFCFRPHEWMMSPVLIPGSVSVYLVLI